MEIIKKPNKFSTNNKIAFISVISSLSILYLINNIVSIEYFSKYVSLPVYTIIPGILIILSMWALSRADKIQDISKKYPNQTDVNFRYYDPVKPPADARVYGPETSIDFKRMVHSIHAGGFRKTPYVVIGFQSSVNDFSDVRFPTELRKSCLKCHVVDAATGKGSYELPLKSAVLGTTVNTQSAYLAPGGSPQRSIDVNPANDLKITPTAATCSGCHDSSEMRSHMIRTGGASFATTQDRIGTTVKERCASCHGPGKDKDVRKVHELSGSSSD